MRNILLTLLLLPLAAAPLRGQRLLAFDSDRTVYELDRTTGARTRLGTVSSNVGIAAGLAYDLLHGKLYLSSTSTDSLYLLDVTDWSATWVGGYGGAFLLMHGIEYDPTTDQLFGMSSHVNRLYSLDRSTGAATLIGATGLISSYANLVFDLTRGMRMTDGSSDGLYTIDTTTAAVTWIGPLAGPAPVCTSANGLAYDLDHDTLYMVDNQTDHLYTIDPLTAATTPIGPVGSSNLLGLVYIPGTGRLERSAHGCGATTIHVTGHPEIGNVIEFTLGNTTGFPLVGFGLTNISVPFCACTIGHEWAVAIFGNTVQLPVPPNPTLIGMQVLTQGMDLLGAGGCADPLLTLTDTITLTL
ncbi:MAG: hypothetical protein JNN13_06380 [Planctomycetes bacterium]|nr:hypothetical protein [Planctomycetota bacterium]